MVFQILILLFSNYAHRLWKVIWLQLWLLWHQKLFILHFVSDHLWHLYQSQ